MFAAYIKNPVAAIVIAQQVIRLETPHSAADYRNIKDVMRRKNAFFVAVFSLFLALMVVHAVTDKDIIVSGQIISCQG
jgi:hypothetical protein